MITNAYVVLSTEPSLHQAVIERMSTIPRAIIHRVRGPHSIVVELSEDTTVDVTTVVNSKIRPVPGIKEALTYICDSLVDAHAGGE